MPVIVVGADTEAGEAILDGLAGQRQEIRAFVSDEAVGRALKEQGVKVALGDVTDEGHVEAASALAFTAVLVTEAARDDRERSFARTPEQVLGGWARAVSAAKVTRVIWVASGLTPPTTEVEEVATVDPLDPDMVAKVVALDDAHSI